MLKTAAVIALDLTVGTALRGCAILGLCLLAAPFWVLQRLPGGDH